MTLIDRATGFIEGGHPTELSQLLADCVAAGNSEGLLAVQLLARDMYGGITFNWELKAPAAYCLLAWGQGGLKALVENALEEPTSKNFSLAFQLLSSIADGHEPQSTASFVSAFQLRQAVSSAVGNWNDLALAARSRLHELMLSIDNDDQAGIYVATSLMGLSLLEPSSIRHLSHALALRTTAVGPRVLTAYDDLLVRAGNDESVFQHFFERHPLLLDSRAFQVWGKPDLHGKLEPDFIIRTYDDNYVIVEIETPAKRLVTKRGNLSADATHAIDQVLEYQDYLGTHIAEASVAFPQFTSSIGLVVVGCEASLNDNQKDVLRRVNQSRPNIRIVGFDKLAGTAKAVTGNVIHGIPETILGVRLQ